MLFRSLVSCSTSDHVVPASSLGGCLFYSPPTYTPPFSRIIFETYHTPIDGEMLRIWFRVSQGVAINRVFVILFSMQKILATSRGGKRLLLSGLRLRDVQFIIFAVALNWLCAPANGAVDDIASTRLPASRQFTATAMKSNKIET